MANEFKLSHTAAEIDRRLGEIDNLAKKTDIPSKLSELTNDSNFATESYVDTAIANIDIPEVDLSGYALKSEIPTDYLTEIPEEYVTETELNARGYLTSYTETDPTVPAWAKKANKPTYTAEEVGALPADTVIPSIEGLATENYVNTQVANLVNSAPDKLNTLDELAAALGDDENFANTVTTELSKKANKEDLLNEDDILKKEVLPDGYPYMEIGAVVPETTVVIDLDAGQGVIVDEFTLVEGDSYEVVWNGVSYNCIATAFSLEGLNMISLGNLDYIGGQHTEEPFGIFNLDDSMASALGAYGMVIPYDESTEVVLSINGTIVQKMNPAFMPPIDKMKYLIDGDAMGSIRSIGAATNDDEYSIGEFAVSLGNSTKASGYASHAEGSGTTASAEGSHAEGCATTASGRYSHAEGYWTTASGSRSHAEGYSTTASSDGQHVQGKYNIEDIADKYAHIVGNGTSSSKRSNAHTLDWNGNAWFKGSVYVYGTDQNNGASRLTTEADVERSIETYGIGRDCEGCTYNINGTDEVAEFGAEIFNEYTANKAVRRYSHAEGYGTTAYGGCSHAEGANTIAYGEDSHAEGYGTTAYGSRSHAEGAGTTASGSRSHAEGIGTIAYGEDSHVQGKYNIEDTANKYAHIIGNGMHNERRSNAHTLDWYGNAWFAGNIYIGGTGQDDTAAIKVAIVPFPTEADEGKFLRVVNGVPTWVSIPNAEEATF